MAMQQAPQSFLSLLTGWILHPISNKGSVIIDLGKKQHKAFHRDAQYYFTS